MLEALVRRFAVWRAAMWLRRAKQALAKHDWWRGRGGEP